MRPSRSTHWVLLIGLLVGALTGCGNGSSGGNPAPLSGIQGQATRGPITPNSQQGQSNDAPLPGAVIVVRRPDGSEAARQTTDGQGNFKFGLSPGSYQVAGLAINGSLGFPIPPAAQTVTVPVDQYITVNVSYDTGIR